MLWCNRSALWSLRTNPVSRPANAGARSEGWRNRGHGRAGDLTIDDVGASSFLYPFLGKDEQPLEEVVREVQGSMLQKMRETNRLRAAATESEAVSERLDRGGKVIAFGSGGSATEANDLAADCVDPPHARPEDVTVGISTSGGSANILAALAEARGRGLLTVGVVGYDGGRIKSTQLTKRVSVFAVSQVMRAG